VRISEVRPHFQNSVNKLVSTPSIFASRLVSTAAIFVSTEAIFVSRLVSTEAIFVSRLVSTAAIFVSTEAILVSRLVSTAAIFVPRLVSTEAILVFRLELGSDTGDLFAQIAPHVVEVGFELRLHLLPSILERIGLVRLLGQCRLKEYLLSRVLTKETPFPDTKTEVFVKIKQASRRELRCPGQLQIRHLQ
jgi:hypothetical protein